MGSCCLWSLVVSVSPFSFFFPDVSFMITLLRLEWLWVVWIGELTNGFVNTPINYLLKKKLKVKAFDFFKFIVDCSVAALLSKCECELETS